MLLYQVRHGARLQQARWLCLQHDTCPLVIFHSIVFKVLFLFSFFHHFLILVVLLSTAWQCNVG